MRCERCGQEIKIMGLHRGPCSRTPRPDELARILDKEPAVSMTELASRYEVGVGTIYRRLENTKWTSSRLKKRGDKIRAMRSNLAPDHPGRKRCKCGILISVKAESCQWCLDESQGITNWRIRHGIRSWSLL